MAKASSYADDIKDEYKAVRKLTSAAKKDEGVTLSADETKRIQKHIEWLSGERESLIRSLPDDD